LTIASRGAGSVAAPGTGSLLQILIAAGLVFAIAGVFATLLVVAERVLVRYGTCTIDVNDGSRQLKVQGGQSLLASLVSEGIFIPSACGGRGTCAYCKVRILEGGGPLVPTEVPLLTEEEIAEDVRVSCQVKVRNDMAIRIPEELFNVREYRGVLERITDRTHDIKELRIRLVEPETIRFVPGQYMQIQTPDRPDQESVYRAYSISSPAYEDGFVEFIIRLVPGGICTTWVFEELHEGDEITMTGPFGEFRLSDTDREMVWIAGGSGMAPFWSMVRQMKQDGVSRSVTYYFGAVRPRDLFLVDELRALEKELPGFRFMPALSGPQEEDHWDGEQGLITEVVDRNLKDGTEVEGYLCGSPGMIDASTKVLQQKGITEARTFYDKFA
jgi:Na+-transporting NADH:ubiquinone oxidoreductase subunit F